MPRGIDRKQIGCMIRYIIRLKFWCSSISGSVVRNASYPNHIVNATSKTGRKSGWWIGFGGGPLLSGRFELDSAAPSLDRSLIGRHHSAAHATVE